MHNLQVWKMKKKFTSKNWKKKQPKQSILLQINEDASTQTPNIEGATTMSKQVQKMNHQEWMDAVQTFLIYIAAAR